ncbi:MAG: permease-like cell division protein FtsX [bacterium]
MLANIKHILNITKSRIDLDVYLRDLNNEQDYLSLEQQIKSLQGIESIKYISKEEAFQTAQEDSILRHALMVIQSNPLPSSFKITLTPDYRKLEKINVLHNKIKMLAGVEDVSPVKAWVPKLEKFQKSFMFYSTLMMIVIGVNLLMVASNSIRQSINSRSNMIEIMRLLGSDRFTIVMIFVVENLIKGTAGGFTGGTILFALYLAGKKMFPVMTFFPEIFISQIIFGALIGVIGSVFTLKRLIR